MWGGVGVVGDLVERILGVHCHYWVMGRLVEIEERWKDVSPGPWRAKRTKGVTEWGEAGFDVVESLHDGSWFEVVSREVGVNTKNNCAAIASAPDDVEWLVRVLKRERSEKRRLQRKLDHIRASEGS